jgi:uncharacterized membrane protein HdeD (DUF308 family)
MRTRTVIGVGLCLVGVVWIGQGIGLIGGSFMSGQAVWAVVGAIVIIFGASLISGVRRARRDRDSADKQAD